MGRLTDLGVPRFGLLHPGLPRSGLPRSRPPRSRLARLILPLLACAVPDPVLAPVLAHATEEKAMHQQHRALSLSTVPMGDDMVEIVLTAATNEPMQVRYNVELVGRSCTRHSGATRIMPGERQTLSRLRTREPAWCVTVQVEQSDGLRYRLVEGTCQ